MAEIKTTSRLITYKSQTYKIHFDIDQDGEVALTNDGDTACEGTKDLYVDAFKKGEDYDDIDRYLLSAYRNEVA